MLLMLQCVQYVDDSVLSELVPRLTELIRAGVGLGTKVGAVISPVTLTYIYKFIKCQNHNSEFATYDNYH